MSSTADELSERIKLLDERMRDINRESAMLAQLAHIAWLLTIECDDTATRH